MLDRLGLYIDVGSNLFDGPDVLDVYNDFDVLGGLDVFDNINIFSGLVSSYLTILRCFFETLILRCMTSFSQMGWLTIE